MFYLTLRWIGFVWMVCTNLFGGRFLDMKMRLRRQGVLVRSSLLNTSSDLDY